MPLIFVLMVGDWEKLSSVYVYIYIWCDGYLLCYHYRTISKEFTKEKIKSSSIYKKKNITFDDIMSNDYPEILDERLKNMIYSRNINNKY